MKKKGLLAVGIVCAVSFVTTIGLGIAGIASAVVNMENGTIQRAWEEFSQRYHLSHSYGGFTSVQEADADNRIDLSVIPEGSRLEIECGSAALNLQSGNAAEARINRAASSGDYRFELFQKNREPHTYLLVLEWGGIFSDSSLTVTVPDGYLDTICVESGSGATILSDLSARILEVDSGNGKISAANPQAEQILLSSDNGSVDLSNPAGASWIRCDSGNGTIRFSAGAMADFTVQAQAENGEILNNIAPARSSNDAVYSFGSPGGTTVQLESDNGRIEINP